MATKAASPSRRIGRPPAGARDGEKVKDYPQLSIRLPDDVKATLQALSLLRVAAAVADHHRGDRVPFVV